MPQKVVSILPNVRWRKSGGKVFILGPNDGKCHIFTHPIADGIGDDGVINMHIVGSKVGHFLDKLKVSGARKSIQKGRPVNRNAPLNVTLQITNRCNLNCIHCHNVKERPATLGKRKLFSLLNELAEFGVFNINFSGGEPLTVPYIFDAIRETRRLGMGCTMSTNLTLINEDIAQRLATAGLTRMHISLDSNKQAEHDRIRGVFGAFQRMVSNLRHIQQCGIDYTFVTTLVDQTPNELEEVVDLAHQLGASAHKTNSVVPQGRAASSLVSKARIIQETIRLSKLAKKWLTLRREYRGKMPLLAETMFAVIIGSSATEKLPHDGCPAGDLTCAVNEKGHVLPCSFFSGYSLGNVFHRSFQSIWSGKAVTKLRHAKTEQRDCRARAFGSFGDVSAPDPILYK